MGRAQKATELLEVVRLMAAAGRYQDVFAIEAALILQGRDEGLSQLKDPALRRELNDICTQSSLRRTQSLTSTAHTKVLKPPIS